MRAVENERPKVSVCPISRKITPVEIDISFTRSSFQRFQRVRVAGHLIKAVHHFEAHPCEAVKVAVSVNLRFDSQPYVSGNEDGNSYMIQNHCLGLLILDPLDTV